MTEATFLTILKVSTQLNNSLIVRTFQKCILSVNFLKQMLQGFLQGPPNRSNNPSQSQGNQSNLNPSNKPSPRPSQNPLGTLFGGKILQDLLKKDIQKTNMKYEYPATISSAKVHTNAVKFGYKPQAGFNRVICPCCNYQVENQEIGLCYPTTSAQGTKQQPFKLISSVSLFFSFIKMTIWYLLMRCILTDFYNIISSLTAGNLCVQSQDTKCAKVFFTLSSSVNKVDREDLALILDIFNLVTIIVSIVFFILYRKVQYGLYSDIDEQNQTEDDYTLFLENIPILDFEPESFKNEEFHYDKHLQRNIEEKIAAWLSLRSNWPEEEGSIEDHFNHITRRERPAHGIITTISLCYDLTEFEKITKLREERMTVHEEQQNITQQLPEDEQAVVFKGNNISDEIHIVNANQSELSKRFASDPSLLFNMTHFVGSAFVSFQYQHYRDYIIRECAKDKTFLSYNMNNLTVSAATHPRDINWKNMRISNQDRLKRQIISYLILIMVLTFAFGSLVGNDMIKAYNITENEQGIEGQIKNYVLTLAGTIFTLVINYGLSEVILMLVDSEHHKTKTDYVFSLIAKMLVSQFINTALIYYIISVIIQKPLLSAAGLVLQVSSLIVVSGFIQIFVNAANVPALMRSALIWWKYRNLDDKDQILKFQMRLNKEFEFTQFNISQRYAYYLLQVYTAVFYSYIAPVGVPAVLGIFFVQYWIDKHNLFTKSSLFFNLNFHLSRKILKLFQASLLVFAAGNVIFSLHFHHHNLNGINIAGLVIAFLYVVFITLAPYSLEKKLLNNYETLEEFTYDECVVKGKFRTTYWRENPATMLADQEKATGRKLVKNPALNQVLADITQLLPNFKY